MDLILFYESTLEEYLVLFGGVFIVLLIGYLVTKYTKYGGGSNYGMDGDDNFLNDDWDTDDFD